MKKDNLIYHFKKPLMKALMIPNPLLYYKDLMGTVYFLQ